MSAFAHGHAPRARHRLRVRHVRIGRQHIRYGIRAGDGSRAPLLIMNGLGGNIELARPFIDALEGPAIVIFDVPGVGGSPAPRAPYGASCVARMAERLLDHLRYDEVDVLGVSWGGAIAQQLAVRNPARCRRLVLAATATGALMVPGKPSVLLRMITPRRYMDAPHARQIAGSIYGGAFRDDLELAERTLRHVRFSSRRGYYLQLAAICSWTSLPWLWMLRQPTLIMAGADDPIVPFANARLMRWLIPDSRLAVLDCGHLFLFTRPAESARLVDEFLTHHTPPDLGALTSGDPT